MKLAKDLKTLIEKKSPDSNQGLLTASQTLLQLSNWDSGIRAEDIWYLILYRVEGLPYEHPINEALERGCACTGEQFQPRADCWLCVLELYSTFVGRNKERGANGSGRFRPENVMSKCLQS